MTSYFLKVTIIPTWKSKITETKIEYYGKVEFHFNDISVLTAKELEIYGFKSIKAAETAKKNREAFYTRDDTKFGTFNHVVEIVERRVDE